MTQLPSVPGVFYLGISELGNLDPTNAQDVERLFYSSICTAAEVDRVLVPHSAEDYLLKMRADAALDSTRLLRVILARKRRQGGSWHFGDHFDRAAIDAYLSVLPGDLHAQCSTVPAGLVFSNDPNGACIRTDYGNIVVVSECLRYFLYFMTLAFLDCDVSVPLDVRQNALRIAMRTMLQMEATDFDLDPRGRVPELLDSQVRAHVTQQLMFVIGHEYGHHVLRHLEKGKTVPRQLFVLPEGSRGKAYDFYNHSQCQELEADEWSIRSPRLDIQGRRDLAVGGAMFFAFLMVYDQVVQQLFPLPATQERTHPQPMDRLTTLSSHTWELSGIEAMGLLDTVSSFSAFLSDDISTNVEAYETYGSVYLGSWRGKPLVDRVDY